MFKGYRKHKKQAFYRKKYFEMQNVLLQNCQIDKSGGTNYANVVENVFGNQISKIQEHQDCIVPGSAK